ncbi:hypothetical protein HDU83_009391 [Entophlyctis luteolus]|nr:hypothetical protein HDU83_009391 [Entophlyctis luteolus]
MSRKDYHFFVSYRVNTDGDLAERITDKLQQLSIATEKRDVRLKGFFDKQNLVSGVDFTTQFLTGTPPFLNAIQIVSLNIDAGLHGSCLFLPLVSEACLESMLSIEIGHDDNVVREWQTALDLCANGEIEIIPILVGVNRNVDGCAVYQKFNGFGLLGQLPDFPVSSAPANGLTVKEVVSEIFKLQGIFLNPQDVVERLSVIQTRFSAEVWPKYRKYWANQQEIGAEPKYTCVQCKQEFTESSNGEGSRVDFVNEFAYISADDFNENDEGVVVARIGAVLSAHPEESDKIFVDVKCGTEAWCQTFSKSEVAAANVSEPVVFLNGTNKEYTKVQWTTVDHTAVCITMSCAASTSMNPASASISFNWPDVSKKNGPTLSTVEFSDLPQFGEKGLSEKLQKEENVYHFPKEIKMIGDTIQLPPARKAESTLPIYASPKTPLKVKVLSSFVRFDSRSKTDYFVFEVSVTNTSDKGNLVAGISAFAKFRMPADAQLKVPDTNEEGFVLTGNWKSMDDVDIDSANKLPVTVAAAESSKISLSVRLSAAQYCPKNDFVCSARYSRISMHSGFPILLDLEFEDIKGEKFGTIVEMVIPEIRLEQPEVDALFSMIVDDAVVYDREITQLKRPTEYPLNGDDSKDPLYLRDHATLFTVNTGNSGRGVNTAVLRHFVLKAEEQKNKTNSSSAFGVYDATSVVTTKYLPYTDFDRSRFQVHVYAIVDFSRRSVVAFRFQAITRTMESVGYYYVAPYGDALQKGASAVDVIPVFESGACDTFQDWISAESKMHPFVNIGSQPPQTLPPVEPRIVFAPASSDGNSAEDTRSATVDSKALIDALRPAIAQELRDTLRAELVGEVRAALKEEIKAEIQKSVRESVKEALLDVFQDLRRSGNEVRADNNTPRRSSLAEILSKLWGADKRDG